jgi:hypothetical protein
MVFTFLTFYHIGQADVVIVIFRCNRMLFLFAKVAFSCFTGKTIGQITRWKPKYRRHSRPQATGRPEHNFTPEAFPLNNHSSGAQSGVWTDYTVHNTERCFPVGRGPIRGYGVVGISFTPLCARLERGCLEATPPV